MSRPGKRIGQAIGSHLPMPVCRFINWAARRWAPGLWQEALNEAQVDRSISPNEGGRSVGG